MPTMVYNDTLPPMIVLPQPIVCMSPIGRDTFSFLSRPSVVWVPNQLSSELEIEWRLTVNVKCAQQIIFVTSMQAYTNIVQDGKDEGSISTILMLSRGSLATSGHRTHWSCSYHIPQRD